jgi:hypothetical protein
VRIELQGAQETPELCNDFLNICGSDALEPTGPVDCSPRYQWADRNWCDVELECGFPATLDGQQVEVFKYQYAGCENTDANTWECWCGNGASETFTVESDGGWDACSAVVDQCGAN